MCASCRRLPIRGVPLDFGIGRDERMQGPGCKKLHAVCTSVPFYERLVLITFYLHTDDHSFRTLLGSSEPILQGLVKSGYFFAPSVYSKR